MLECLCGTLRLTGWARDVVASSWRARGQEEETASPWFLAGAGGISRVQVAYLAVTKAD